MESNEEKLRRNLEGTCENVLSHYRSHMTPESRELAQAKLDGVFEGVLAVARTLNDHSWENSAIDTAREITEQYFQKIRES